MASEALQRVTQTAILSQADNDAQVVELWLHGRSPHTQRAYIGTKQRKRLLRVDYFSFARQFAVEY